MAPLLVYLRGLGVVPAASLSCPSTRAELLGERFRAYLTVERGLTKGTVTGYVDAVKPFLAALDDDGFDLRDLSAGWVTTFVVARCSGQSRGAAKMTVTALRSLLGFLQVEGMIGGSLLGAVPSAASWRLSGLPRFLESGQAQALLDSCDQQTVVGRRDLAIMTLLLRLGLRAGEVAGLSLEDVDWRAGELVVVGKGRFARATARRVVRSEPIYPIATRRSCALSARIFPRERFTHSSIFSANPSTLGRTRLAAGSPPPASSRARTQCATVL